METANVYDIGDGVVLEGDFSKDDAPAVPATVICRVRKPREAVLIEISAEHVGPVTNDAGHEVERYRAEVTVDARGDWYYRFEGSGGIVAAGERRFYVRPSRVLP